MNDEKALSDIKNVIAAGQLDTAEVLLMNRASSAEDPLVKIQCASILLVIGRSETSDEVLEELYDEVYGEADMFPVAQAMRGLGRGDLALGLLEGSEESDDVLREKAMSFNMTGRFEEAIENLEKISAMTADDSVLFLESLGSLGKHGEALKLSEKLSEEFPDNYNVLRSRGGALIAAGEEKEALKYARKLMKANKNSADANAVGAYVMYVIGNTKPAGAFSSKALRTDPTHVGAMEILALSLVDRGEFKKASIVAGAMNEKEPGNPAAVRILRLCGGKFS
ncbi:MAG: tetratricopeptide repeat protein [Candidatus Methanomethylophilaceae archaeon]